MIPLNNIFVKAKHSKHDYFFHIAFAVLLCLYSFLILFSNKLLGFLFFVNGLLLLGFTVWKGIKAIPSAVSVLVLLCLLFFSRLFWMEAFQVLPLFFYEIFQFVFFLGFALGIALLYSLAVKSAPLSNQLGRHAIHGMYFLTGLLLIPYTWIFSYGAIMKEDFIGVFWAILSIVLWGILYFVQLASHEIPWMKIALYAVNIGVGCWAIMRWTTILV